MDVEMDKSRIKLRTFRYMKTVTPGSGSGGVFELNSVPHHPVWSDRPKNLGSHTHELGLEGVFDRFENFSFLGEVRSL